MAARADSRKFSAPRNRKSSRGGRREGVLPKGKGREMEAVATLADGGNPKGLLDLDVAAVGLGNTAALR